MTRRVVITGVGAITPLGVGAEPLIERWIAGECGIEDGEGRCRDFDRHRLPLEEGGATLGPLRADGRGRRSGGDRRRPESPRSCRTSRTGSAAWSGPGSAACPRWRRTSASSIERGEKAVSPLAVPLMMGNAAAAAVAMQHGLRGHCYGVVSACAAGAHALGDASRIIRAGDADVVVSGGAEAAISGVATAAFGAMEATSPDRDLAPLRRPPRRLRDGRGRRHPRARGEGGGGSARGDDPRRAARLRRHLRRLPPDRAAARRDRGGAGDQPGDRRRRPDAPPTSTTSTRTAPRPRSTTAPRRSR